VRLATSSPPCAECREIWEPKPRGTLWATPGLLRDSFFFNLYTKWAQAFLTFCQFKNMTYYYNVYQIKIGRELNFYSVASCLEK